MRLRTGQTLSSVVDMTSVVVVRAPSEPSALTCGGVAMVDGKQSGSLEAHKTGGSAGLLLGKRYVNEDGSLEVLCVKAGSAEVAVDSRPLQVKEPKPLPASD